MDQRQQHSDQPEWNVCAPSKECSTVQFVFFIIFEFIILHYHHNHSATSSTTNKRYTSAISTSTTTTTTTIRLDCRHSSKTWKGCLAIFKGRTCLWCFKCSIAFCTCVLRPISCVCHLRPAQQPFCIQPTTYGSDKTTAKWPLSGPFTPRCPTCAIPPADEWHL